MPHCTICDSSQDCTLIKGRFYCGKCSADLSEMQINPRYWQQWIDYVKKTRAKVERSAPYASIV